MNKEKYFLIEGGNKLKGEIELQGAKNAALPLFSAMLICEGKTLFKNIPIVEDTLTMLSLVSYLGLNVKINKKDKTVFIENKGLKNSSAPLSYIKKMRASIYVLGPLILHFKKAKVGIPGGCAFGPRPINFHLKGLKKMGVNFELEGGYINAKVNKLKNIKIVLPKISVGTTAHLVTTASKIEGETVIENISIEPEVILLFDFLKKAGAKIYVENRKVIVYGNKNLKAPSEFENIIDRIEAGTYMLFVTATGGEVKIKPNPYKYMEKVIKVINKIGGYVENKEDYLFLKSEGENLKSVSLSTSPYPGYPTDLQPQLVALLTQAKGRSVIRERIYPERFGYVGELIKLGANIEVGHGYARIEGKTKLKSAPLEAPDIRAGAALILAALVAEGKSKIYGIGHIKRGYENIVSKLKKLGAQIEIRRK